MTLGAEDRLHAWLRRRLQRSGFDRVGDDGAVLPAGGPWAVTQDHQIETIHFPRNLDPALIARRLLAVNLSDLAAMGAVPTYAFLALSCPKKFDARRFLAAFIAACQRLDLELAGGDLARNDKVTTSLTLLGTRPAGCRWLARSNGRADDGLWHAGTIGLSAVGRRLLELGARIEGRRVELPQLPGLSIAEQRLSRRAVRCHLAPEPQLAVSKWLAARRRVAAIDVSDGLAIDLHRLCRESGVGGIVDIATLPCPASLPSLCRKLDLPPQGTMLGGGEDYALLFTLPPRSQPPAGLGARQIGRLTQEQDLLLKRDGTTIPLPIAGWDHFDSLSPGD